jgi:YHS domain-containing protein
MLRLLASLLEFVFVVLVGRLLGRAVERLWGGARTRGGFRPANSPADSPHRTVEGQMARDPVCGTFVSTELSHRLDRGGETLHFCSRDCRERYQKTNVSGV